MEAEYVALSTSWKDLFPIVDLTTELCLALNIPLCSNVDLHVKIHEDNAGALALGLLEPRRMMPCSKHCAFKYHWFCEHISPRKINLLKILSDSQLGNIFTKGLVKATFEHLRKKLMGLWPICSFEREYSRYTNLQANQPRYTVPSGLSFSC